MNIFLQDEKVYLKKLLSDESLESYLEFINDIENLTWTDVGIKPFNKEDLTEFLNEIEGLFLGIFTHDNKHIGNIHLSHVNKHNRNAELGIVLARRAHGKGFAKSAIRLVLKHAFEVMNLHRVYLTVIEGNTDAIALYEKLGFIKEGVETESFLYNFKFHNGIRYYMLEENYRQFSGNW